MDRNTFAWRPAPWARLGILFALGLAAPSSAQLGHVVKAQKISATAGGFDAVLEEMDQFGRSIVNLGDLDGDGLTDVLVGAHTDDDGGVDKGSVYILFLNQNGSVKRWQKISDLEGNFAGRLRRGDQFGRAAANLGDLDGDGVVDVAVCANYDDDGGTNKGAVYVLFLNSDGTVKQSQKISSTQGGLPVGLNIHDEFGRSLTALGDMDGDGLTELLVGTPEDDEGGTNTGALHVLFLNANGTVKTYRRIGRSNSGLALKPGDWFGFCSANIGDFDGDGVVDVAVGSVLDDDGGVNQGSLWILFLNADGSVKAAREIDELEGGLPPLDDIDQFGTSVASLGDLDGDGVTDLAVGAVKDDDGGTPGNPDADVGAVYVLLMNADASVKSCVKLSDQPGVLPFALDQWDWFGSALAPLGGSPGDGLFNLAIGCRNDDDAGGNHGAIYLTQLNDGSAPFASFHASQTIGVPPLTVDFTDTSTGIVTGWVWNLGDGPLVTQQNPRKTYNAPGSYDVQLTTRGPKGTDAELKRGLIQVVSGLAAFEASPRSGPCPLPVSFTDRSLGNLTSWSWDFGDGQGSSLRSPQHLYAACGSYTVSLTVSGPSGTFTHSEPAFVTAAVEPPAAAFGLSPASGPAPLDVQFTDASAGQVTSWSWDFGDGQGSLAQDPLHRFEAEGQYTVTLIASGPAGTDSETRAACVTVTGPPPAAYFEANPTIGPEPLSVAFTDITSGTVSAWTWDFGDGASSNARHPVHTYAVPGLYTVTLTATGPGGSDVRVLDDLITVEPAVPSAAFSATPTQGPAPLAVQFTDLSLRTVTSWAWTFGDGAGSSARNPAHVYAQPGVYSVALTVTGPGGSDTRVQSDLIRVQSPPVVAEFSATPSDGLAPLAVQFTNLSAGLATSFVWSFGDGGSSSATDPAHLYVLPGTYTVTLSASGPGGSDVETKTGYITVRSLEPVAEFSAAPSAGVAPLAVQFDNLSTGLVTSFAWSFGDGSSSSATDPAHLYVLPGTYTVTLSASGPGGSDVETKTDYVTVRSSTPTAAFRAAPTSGVAPLAVQFEDASSGPISSWAWDFGDGATASGASPAHTYAAPGTYSVRLAVRGPGGSSEALLPDLVHVSALPPLAEFVPSPREGFAPLQVLFDEQSTGLVTAWSWNFGDGEVSDLRDPVHVFVVPDSYAVTLQASGPGGISVRRRTIVVRPAPLFADGSFELQAPGLAPVLPWSVYNGTSLVVQTSSQASDQGFPSAGTQWCDIGAEGSSNARPPSNPRGNGSSPAGASGLQQDFLFPAATPHLFFDAAFLLNGVKESPARNDFMSVDLTDGVSIWNVYYADSFSEFPLVSSLHGLAMTARQSVHVDLRALFPDASESTVLSLRAGVGNVGGVINPSRGYIDGFRLAPSGSASFRNGHDLNPLIYTSAPAVVGGTWEFTIDSSSHPEARLVVIHARTRALAGHLLVGGELLIAGPFLLRMSFPARGALQRFVIDIPNDPVLVGLSAYTQASLFAGGLLRGNAYDLHLGY